MQGQFRPQTPMLQQYFRLKAEYPDVLLAMQVGDFYEFYGPDAEIAARELEIVLTGREDGSNGRIPMAGVPIHAYERYLAKLVQKGYRVAICDQIEDPKLAKGLVKRRVTRVLTPGTVVEDSMLDARANNYLVAAVLGDPIHGLGIVDVSTGEFLTTEIAGEGRQQKLLDELFRLQPAEVLVPEDHEELDSDPARATKRDDYARTAAGMGRARGTRDSAAPFWGGVAARVRLRGVHARAGRRRACPALPAAEPDDRAGTYPHAGDLLGGAVYVP
jgi:DNA mismatch repair ATPase MutS